MAATYSKSLAQVKFYINGAPQETLTALTPPSINANQAFRIGSWAGGAGREFVGDIDEIRIWSVVRTPAEIAASYACELEVPQTGLEMYYQFNQGNAGLNNPGVTTLTDISTNGRNGTLTNFALTGASSNWVTPGGVTSNSSCSATLGDYRTIASGTWENSFNWQRFNGTAWVGGAPSSGNNNISVRHAMTINGNLTLDQTTVLSNAYIQVNSGTLTINNGTGTDLALNSSNALFMGKWRAVECKQRCACFRPQCQLILQGATLTNNGTINLSSFSMSPDPGHRSLMVMVPF